MSTYISLDNLARYDMKAKARAEGLYADASAACWQKTEKAGAVTCVPAPETPLEPVVEFLFTETLPDGTKGPENPSVFEGVSSIECSYGGKNLLYYPLDTLTKTIDGVTFTYSSDGSFSASGTSTRNPVIYRIAYSTGNQSVYSYLPAGTYTLSGCPQNGSWNTYSLVMMDTDGFLKDNLGNSVIEYGSGRTFTIDEPKRIFCMMRLGYAVGTNISGIVYRPQLEIGSSVTTLEPANRSKLPLSLPSTFYGGTLDVASGKLTVTHRMVEPSSGTVDISDRPALLPLEFTDTYGRTIASADGMSLDCGSSGGQIVYRLTNPYTVQIDPTPIDSLPALGKTSPRINTVYTDAENVQVGYAEHPAYTEELINNAILALGGNI